jgi:hypothetical protein
VLPCSLVGHSYAERQDPPNFIKSKCSSLWLHSSGSLCTSEVLYGSDARNSKSHFLNRRTEILCLRYTYSRFPASRVTIQITAFPSGAKAAGQFFSESPICAIIRSDLESNF